VVKFTTQTATGPLIGLGVSEGNVERLKKGEPILVELNEIGQGGGQILLMYGETEKAIVAELESNGLMTTETVVQHPDANFPTDSKH